MKNSSIKLTIIVLILVICLGGVIYLYFNWYERNQICKEEDEDPCPGYVDSGGIYDFPLDQRLDLQEFVTSLPVGVELVAQYFDVQELFMTVEEYNENRANLENNGKCPDNGYCSELTEGKLTEVAQNILATVIDGEVFRQQRDSIILSQKINNNLVLYLKLYDRKIDNGEFTTVYKFETYGGCDLSRNELLLKFEDMLNKINIIVPKDLEKIKIKESDMGPRYMDNGVMKPIPR